MDSTESDSGPFSELAFRLSPTPTIVVSRAGEILDMSDAFLHLVAADRQAVIGSPLTDFVHPDDAAQVDLDSARLFDPAHPVQVRIVRAGWGVVWVSIGITEVQRRDRPDVIVMAFDDITQYRKAERALAHRASHDPLTGLPNRAVLMSHLGRVLARLGRRPGTVALLFVDLDGFKTINDTHGHRAGDSVLRDVAGRIVAAVRGDDVVARMGGDEFVVVCDSLESSVESALVAERIRAAMEGPFEAHGRTHRIAASIGVAQTSDAGTSGEDLLRRADLAMYRAKERGRNRVEFFAADLEEKVLRRVRMVDVARRAIGEDQLRIVVQPIFRLSDHYACGYEALARLPIGASAVLTPTQFLAAADEAGLLAYLDEQVVDLGLQWKRDKHGSGDSWLAVNVSARSLEIAGFAENMLDRVLTAGLQPSDIVVEVSEATMLSGGGIPPSGGTLSGGGTTVQRLRELREHGFRVAMDDFGTGPVPLISLPDLPVDILKIDVELVAGLGLRAEIDALVASVISVAHDLGWAVVAEGVERPLQAEFLRAEGCDMAQGYLLGSTAAVGP